MADLGIAMSELRIAMELPSNEAVRGAVEAGLGATALSASVVASGIEAELLRQIPFRLQAPALPLLDPFMQGFFCARLRACTKRRDLKRFGVRPNWQRIVPP
jgi:DNA-binding transcriptional LysR family regulator